MEINWFILSIVFVGAVVLVFSLIKKDIKEEKKLEKELNYFEKPEERELNDELDI